MNKDELNKWRDSNKRSEPVNLDKYISERGLELIKNIEGHKKPSVVNGIYTSYYGVTQRGIDGLRELTTNFHVSVPEWMIGKDVKTLTEDEAKEVTAYTAVLNTLLVDKFTGTCNFSSWDVDTKEDFLSYFHNQSPYSLRGGLAKEKPGSVLYHIKKNDIYRAAQAIMEDPDGNVTNEYIHKGKLDGMAKRKVLPCFVMGNPNFVYNEEQARDLEQRLRQPDFVKECHRRIGEIGRIARMPGFLQEVKAEVEQEKLFELGQFSKPENKRQKYEDVHPKKEQENPLDKEKSMIGKLSDLYSAFTDGLKNLFTKDNEDSNPYSGNIDLSNRPRVKNPDGSISTVRSMSYNEDGKEILIPTVSDEGNIMEDNEAIAYWKKKVQNLGVYDSVDAANKAAEWIHKDQEKRIGV